MTNELENYPAHRVLAQHFAEWKFNFVTESQCFGFEQNLKGRKKLKVNQGTEEDFLQITTKQIVAEFDSLLAKAAMADELAEALEHCRGYLHWADKKSIETADKALAKYEAQKTTKGE